MMNEKKRLESEKSRKKFACSMMRISLEEAFSEQISDD